MSRSHKKLAPIVGLIILEESQNRQDKKTKNSMSYEDAVEMLQEGEGLNPLQAAISKRFLEAMSEYTHTTDGINKEPTYPILTKPYLKRSSTR